MSHFPAPKELESSFFTSDRWTIFCAVIDNHGDMGVCWRLARQLVREYGFEVVLWIDELQGFARFLGLQEIGDSLDGVQVRHWVSPWPSSVATDTSIAGSAVVIEAFACELPESVTAAIEQSDTPPLWINLEYLSAEPWVTQCHGLRSMHSVTDSEGQTGRIMGKTFFFPGFVPDTGGLLRERDLLAQHEGWQKDEQFSRRQLLSDLGVSQIQELVQDSLLDSRQEVLWISLFTYESSSLASLFTALAEGMDPVLCLVPQGRVLATIGEYLNRKSPLNAGDFVRIGSLSIAAIPFLSQDDYDRLLSVCDLNFVRGEDSFVRAQWAGRPLLWHIYAQDENVHMEKMRAFLTLYCSTDGQELRALARFWEFWNLGEDCRELWHHLRPQLPGLRERAGEWQRKLAQLPDLAANLVKYHRQQLKEKDQEQPVV
ncbi:MAG: elongation factor P maturation arginine rhamnosyltransferase EarP [Gammaproteobacteria bacterium]|nr:elongation factor P maturation arginine rhamnosyltransferase EarP [Gammaproteobacteria bacterium]MDP2142083.1 elongation factor P maturation arginine rhamnosyltransferase EarP [Gammaproteobacteria bacterium]MDP2347244.1 elongation factor P maturation arginine rhamnosyltransferase EarP [Gammaproteobacteria bacterium]